MLICPTCRRGLMKSRVEGQDFWGCHYCQVKVTSLKGYTQLCGVGSGAPFVQSSKDSANRVGKSCCCCERQMVEVHPYSEEEAPVLDFCPDCLFVVFDPEEWFETRRRFKRGASNSDSSEKLSTGKWLQVETSKRRHDREQYWAEWQKKVAAKERFAVQYTPKEATMLWRFVAMAGLPIEEWEPRFRHAPYLTWILVLTVCVISVSAFSMDRQSYVAYAFVPGMLSWSTWWRGLSAFFLHGDYLHLLGNMYFFWIFGDNVEDYLGKFRYVLLLLVATLAGSFAHWAMNPSSMIPCIGASGGISGVIVFYALQFPRARVAIAPPIVSPVFALFWLVRLSVGWALIIWFGMQALYLFLQANMLSNVSAAAHLGGAAAGAIMWKLWRSRLL